MIQRSIEPELIRRMEQPSGNKKIIIIYGARQVGKTTLVKEFLTRIPGRSEYFNCDYLETQRLFSWENAGNFINIVRNLDVLVLDEAQRILNIGLVLKILHDDFPHLQVIATGSSSFDLSNKVNEPLTGRKIVYKLFPFGFNEPYNNSGFIESKTAMERILRFGSYPAVLLADDKMAKENLLDISSSYLFKDILEFQHIKKPELLHNLLKLIAFQISNEVSYTELANTLRVDQTVIQRYIQLLEDSYVIFRLPALKRNLRSEIGKSRKIYFWDLGIRNAIIQNFNTLDLRNDKGPLWENFCISERLKFLSNDVPYTVNSYFWRTYTQKEIDLIEENNNAFKAFEFKWSPDKKNTIPRDFKENYPLAQFRIIHPDNFREELFKA